MQQFVRTCCMELWDRNNSDSHTDRQTDVLKTQQIHIVVPDAIHNLKFYCITACLMVGWFMRKLKVVRQTMQELYLTMQTSHFWRYILKLKQKMTRNRKNYGSRAYLRTNVSLLWFKTFVLLLRINTLVSSRLFAFHYSLRLVIFVSMHIHFMTKFKNFDVVIRSF